MDRLDCEINTDVEASRHENTTFLWEFIRRIDDIADLGILAGSQADKYVDNLLEYQLSLINYLQKDVGEETIEKLLKRFSSRQALRAQRLIPYLVASDPLPSIWG